MMLVWKNEPTKKLTRFATGLGEKPSFFRYVSLFFAGVLAALSLPPFEFLPAFYVALPILIWALPKKARLWCLFFSGWWFGFGYFVSGLYWIGSAMLVESKQNAWLVPFASLGLPAFLSVFFGIAVLPAKFGKDYLARAFILTTSLGAAEWVRGHVLTGFPWNLLGQAWVSHDVLLQGVSLFGIYGVTFLALLSGFLMSLLAQEKSKPILISLAVAVMLPISFASFGLVRLLFAPPVGSDWVQGVGIRIVQGGIPQKEKWDRRYLVRNFNRYLFLSTHNRPDWVNHVIWPETASPFPLDTNASAQMAAAKVVPQEGTLIAGMIRREIWPEKKIWNSIIALNDSGRIIGTYDKSRLVPFGEYIPGRDFLPLEKITDGSLDYSFGPGPSVWQLGSLPPVSPLICYEIIFSGSVLPADKRPNWILVLTNDAWYGRTSGPYQHLSIARIRAVEEGLPIIRAANTGISAVFDGYGREWSRIELSEEGILDTRLPNSSTIYPFWSQNSKIPFFIFIIIGITGLIVRNGVKSGIAILQSK